MTTRSDLLSAKTGFNDVEAVIGNAIDHSTSETNTGAKWIDGKDIYRKVVDTGAMPNSTTKTVAHGLTSVDRVITIYGSTNRSSDNFTLPLPRAATTTSATIDLYIDKKNSGNVVIVTAANQTAFDSSYVVIEYTKT